MEINNETLGQTVEKAICDHCKLTSSSLDARSNTILYRRIEKLVEAALHELPPIVRHVGLERGSRGGQSKSAVDFIFANGQTLSVKTNLNKNSKVCPSECGQPGRDTFDLYFSHMYDKPVDYGKFKRLVIEKSHLMMPIYLDHLFDCDYLLWIYLGKVPGYRILRKIDIPKMQWLKNGFSFTKTLLTWNESCTVKYRGKSVGEFQAHQHRHNYKFRFNLKILCELLGLNRPVS